jgi:hypothetical protein
LISLAVTLNYAPCNSIRNRFLVVDVGLKVFLISKKANLKKVIRKTCLPSGPDKAEVILLCGSSRIELACLGIDFLVKDIVPVGIIIRPGEGARLVKNLPR